MLGEEEYEYNGEIKTRLRVVAVRSVKAILDGDFTVPPKKLLEPEARPADTNFTILDDSDDLPF